MTVIGHGMGVLVARSSTDPVALPGSIQGDPPLSAEAPVRRQLEAYQVVDGLIAAIWTFDGT